MLACSAPSPGGLVDQVGDRVRPGPVHRIIPLAPDVTELAFALGAGNLVVAVTPAADFPRVADNLPRVQPADAEAILALKPDLVLATTAGNDLPTIDRLRRLGVRVCTVDVTSFDRLTAACLLLGKVIGAPEAGRRLAAAITAAVEAASARARRLPRRRALYVVWWDPLIVAAPGSFHDDLLGRAGLLNLAPAGAGRYPRVDPEVLLAPRLEVVVAPDERDVRAGLQRLLATPAGARLRASSLLVIWLPADPASRPGPRLTLALETLVAAREAVEEPPSPSRGPEVTVEGPGAPPTRSDPAPAGGGSPR